MAVGTYFENYMQAIRTPPKELEETFASEREVLLRLLSGKTPVLEMGCGAGRPISALAEDLPSSTFFGMDNEEPMIEEALKATSKLPNVKIAHCDAFNPRFPFDYFDAVYSTYNLIGSVDPKKIPILLDAQRCHLKHGAIAVNITWKTDDEVTEFLKRYYGGIGGRIYEIRPDVSITSLGRFYRFDAEKLKRLHHHAGFEELEHFDVGPLWHGVKGTRGRDDG